MNLYHLRYFIELVHTRHYTKAAARLGITQPSLSHAISQLENELGVPLFERERKKRIPHPVWRGISRLRRKFSEHPR